MSRVEWNVCPRFRRDGDDRAILYCNYVVVPDGQETGQPEGVYVAATFAEKRLCSEIAEEMIASLVQEVEGKHLEPAIEKEITDAIRAVNLTELVP